MSLTLQPNTQYMLKMKWSLSTSHGHKYLILDTYLNYIMEERIDYVEAAIESQEYKIDINSEISSVVDQLYTTICTDLFVIVEDDNRINTHIFHYLNEYFMEYLICNPFQVIEGIDMCCICGILIDFIVNTLNKKIENFKNNTDINFLVEKDFINGQIPYNKVNIRGRNNIFQRKNSVEIIEIHELLINEHKVFISFEQFAASILYAIKDKPADIVTTRASLLINLEIEEYFMIYFHMCLSSSYSSNTVSKAEFIKQLEFSTFNLVNLIRKFAEDVERLSKDELNAIISGLFKDNPLVMPKEINPESESPLFLDIEYQIVDYYPRIFIVEDYMKCILLYRDIEFTEQFHICLTKNKLIFKDACIKCLDRIFKTSSNKSRESDKL